MSETKAASGGLTRRSFLKTTGAVAGAVALGSGATLAIAAEDDEKPAASDEKLYSVACRSNCQGGCQYWAHVRDGKLMKLTPERHPDEGYFGACLKGISYVERIYAPTRMQYPMRRVGERGSDQWERISWDEAVEEIATKFNNSIEQYGGRSVVIDALSGNFGFLNGSYTLFNRLSAVIGATKPTSCYDYATGYGTNRVLGTGDWNYCHEIKSVLDASLIVMWGTNPVFTAPQNWRWMQWAHENGARLIAIDPIKSATAHRCDEWIPIKPGEDGYLALAMSNYIVQNDLVNWKFLTERSDAAYLVRKDTQKFLRKSDYGEVHLDPATNKLADDFYVWDKAVGAPVLIGDAQDPAYEGSFVTPDGIQVDTAFSLLKKQLAQYSVEEASRLTSIPEDRIIRLAEEFVTEKNVTINITYGIDHYVNGYQSNWAIAILLALTGQLARSGAGFVGVFSGAYFPNVADVWANVPDFKALNTEVPNCLLADLFANQSLEGKDYPVRTMLSFASNPISNTPSAREWMDKVFPNLDFWVVLDTTMGDSCRYADMVLPVASWYEKEDFRTGMNNPYMTVSEKAIEPLYESKPEWEIACLIGRAMGYEASFPEDTTAESLLDQMFSDDISKSFGYSWNRLKEEKIIKITTNEPGEPWIRGESEPFPTEDARVHLYCESPTPRLDYGQDLSERDPHEHIVYYQPPLECGADNELAKKYPLTYVQEHSRFRVHSQWWDTPLLRELDPEPFARVNPIEAKARGVENNDVVEVFNDRGHAVLKCRLDESITPGVLSIPKGWQRTQFIEGGFQEMTQPKMDPYPSAASFYDARVDFRKWEG